MAKIHVVKPEFGISGLDTHVINFCTATGAKLFSGDTISSSNIITKRMDGLLNGDITEAETTQLIDCDVLYFPNGQRSRYWRILEKIRDHSNNLMIVNRCGNFIKFQGEVEFINRVFDKIIVPSISLRSSLTWSGVNPKKIVLLRNIISNKFMRTPPSLLGKVRSKYNLHGKYVLLYPARYSSMSNPGEIVSYKGLLVILNAMKDLPQNTHLLIAGSDSNNHSDQNSVKRKLVYLVTSMHLTEKVTFLDTVDCAHDVFPQIIATSNLVLHPNIEPEPLGTVVLEAMLAGKPVLITKLTGALEVMNVSHHNCFPQDTDAVITVENNASDLRNKIIQMMDNPQMAELIGSNAQKTASRFTEKNLISSYQNLFQDKERRLVEFPSLGHQDRG
jgi:glycosyltransferase involved in cell wall biosynthesis